MVDSCFQVKNGLPPSPLGFFLGKHRQKFLAQGVVEGLLEAPDRFQHAFRVTWRLERFICLQTCSILGDDVAVPA
jgi:hypothetical protein